MSSSQILGLSFAMGMSLLAITLLLGWLSNTYSFSENILKWVILPVLGYGIALGLNSLNQYLTCKTILPGQIAIISVTVPIAIFGFLLLTLLPFIRMPIEMAVPTKYVAQYGGVIAVAFYMFWAGMFGEGIAGGFSQSCPS
jgi:hypothetical protein